MISSYANNNSSSETIQVSSVDHDPQDNNADLASIAWDEQCDVLPFIVNGERDGDDGSGLLRDKAWVYSGGIALAGGWVCVCEKESNRTAPVYARVYYKYHDCGRYCLRSRSRVLIRSMGVCLWSIVARLSTTDTHTHRMYKYLQVCILKMRTFTPSTSCLCCI